MITIKLLRLLLTITAATSLAGCDYFADNWETESGKCQTLSSDNNALAVVSKAGVAFIRLENGCPANLDLLGSRFTDITINGDRYRATLLCNSATQNRTVITVGIPDGIPAGGRENATSVLSARALKEFTGFTGAKVTAEGESYHFSKGNFTKACRTFLPSPPGKPRKIATAPVPEEKHFPATPGKLMTETPEPRETGRKSTAPVSPPRGVPAGLTQDIYDRALAEARSTWHIYHPEEDPQPLQWTRSRQPDKTVNGETSRVLRYTTTSPKTGVTSDVDVEIAPDGTPGYAINNDRPSPAQPAPSAPDAAPSSVSAYCRLDNGKSISVSAADGQGYHYIYQDQNNNTELELTEGLFGVKAFHYYTPLGMGAAGYIRFNKKQYDYVLLSLDTGRREFHGIRVYRDGSLVSSHECFSKLELDVSGLTDPAHTDSDKMGDFLTD
ncbi:hypothetical protein MX551_004854 [Salmonella enterica]|nr:hypothetical protein [Salmonella enterica]EDR4378464.1 hypothetical protein [Salmonella enterica]EEA3740522.1 hypothetical protein [Salmonella enterica]EEF4032141.1 hypothetical protein [Salmonella enterica]EEG5735581.1 hypothetical protein [Salmonella enterica]